MRGGILPGEKVGIVGLGGLGQFAAQLAVLNGAELYVAEIKEEDWDYARSLGAKKVVKDVAELEDEGLSLIIDLAGFGTTAAGAIEAVAPGGRVVLVGMGKLEATINTYSMIVKRVDQRGSIGGSKQDIAAVLDWMAQGKLVPKLETISWQEIPRAWSGWRRARSTDASSASTDPTQVRPAPNGGICPEWRRAAALCVGPRAPFPVPGHFRMLAHPVSAGMDGSAGVRSLPAQLPCGGTAHRSCKPEISVARCRTAGSMARARTASGPPTHGTDRDAQFAGGRKHRLSHLGQAFSRKLPRADLPEASARTGRPDAPWGRLSESLP
ncbi:zinc-binding dehydrogenase [Mangrovicoccus sp. HB161399]|uniref:zinc-binding dehydrogenase n=1 Tax=Mangrovicoccus sp. HB161399 TaxID=2720392 RepID=UPI0015569560|nr:zinc-binding dehydrogenase [Mangrovicoccus sp. HB161399]